MAHDLRIRCSSLGKIMVEPKTLKEGPLSVGAKTYIRQLAAEDIFSVDFQISGKPIEKGIEVEPESIALLNRVRGLSLVKNIERRHNDYITGECDLYDPERRRGHDLKSSWSVQTFPICEADCIDKDYLWQAAGYLWLWDAEEWSVDYALVDTPERLIGFEPLQLHIVSHIPEQHRITSWTIKRDPAREVAIAEKVKAARAYYAQVIADFDATHRMPELEAA
jgi:hypothetical protein